MSGARELVRSGIQLFTLPEIYLRLKTLIDDPGSSLADVGRLIGQDPALTARLLRLVNSAWFGFAAKIDTVSRAVTMLGMQQVHDLALATSVAHVFSGISPAVMDMSRFWRNSVHRAVTAKLLATRCNVLDCERLFVAGLLQDIGHLLMYQKMPEPSMQALVRARDEAVPMARIERELMGFDFAQVSGELLAHWNLPASLCKAVRYQLNPARAGDFAFEAAILHLAGLLTEAEHWQQSGDDWLRFSELFAWQITGLPTDCVEPIRRHASQHVDAAMELLFPGMPLAS